MDLIPIVTQKLGAPVVELPFFNSNSHGFSPENHRPRAVPISRTVWKNAFLSAAVGDSANREFMVPKWWWIEATKNGISTTKVPWG